MLTYRFVVIQNFAKKIKHPVYVFVNYHLHQCCKLKFDFQLFYTDLNPKFFVNPPTFHTDILRARMTTEARMVIRPDCLNFVYKLSLNSLYLNEFVTGGQSLLQSRLLACGIRTVGDVIDLDSEGWRCVTSYLDRECLGRPPSTRILQAELTKLHIAYSSRSFRVSFIQEDIAFLLHISGMLWPLKLHRLRFTPLPGH